MTLEDLGQMIMSATPGQDPAGGPYGLFDYPAYSGFVPPHVVRDYRDPRAFAYGKAVYRSSDRDAALREYDRLTLEHIGAVALGLCRAYEALVAPDPS